MDHKTILTAAHCVDGNWHHGGSAYTDWWIRAGTTDKYNGGQKIGISEIIVHPRWLDPINHYYTYADIAIVKIDEPLTFDADVQPACLPSGPLGLQNGGDCWISGWGIYKSKC